MNFHISLLPLFTTVNLVSAAASMVCPLLTSNLSLYENSTTLVQQFKRENLANGINFAFKVLEFGLAF